MVNADMSATDLSPPPFAGARRPLTDDEERWLACAASMAAAGKAAAQPLYGTPLGRSYLGKGAGGDRTLEIDRACEEAILRVLVREAPGDYRLVSEEAGIIGSARAPWRVIVDPLDGSLNAKHGLEPFGASIGIAQGDTLADVTVGYVEDYLRPHAFAACKGAGLLLAGEPGSGSTTLVEPQRFDSALIELLLLEAGRPDRHHFPYHDLSAIAACGRSGEMRVRQLGSIALALCYLAVGVADVLLAAVRARSVDLAAGLVILAEAGGGVAGLDESDYWQQPLDLEKRGAFVAWRKGLDGAEIASRARRLRPALLLSP
jgi:myo-inositol-1(or 4)-monophosphatase